MLLVFFHKFFNPAGGINQPLLPVKNGWQAEQISTFIELSTEPSDTLLPQAQVASILWYSG